jgi:hypothetical protein
MQRFGEMSIVSSELQSNRQQMADQQWSNTSRHPNRPLFTIQALTPKR